MAVASRRAALAMGVCGALLSAAPAWSKEQVPADDMPADAAGTDTAAQRPSAMQQTAGTGAPPLVYVGRGTGGKGGTR
uniref:Uncharacterized protein n=1 Tax=Tetradesmus obliquus TaxID=3088 RepID=A0A383W6P1_TETOB